jgi:tuftelin-interacting protein 11
VKVIDMTGPEQRVLSGYHAIAGQQRPTDEWDPRKEKSFNNFNLPELMHNLDLLVTMCEQVLRNYILELFLLLMVLLLGYP